MPSSVENVAFDCADPHRLATWWLGVVGGELEPQEEQDDDEAVIIGASHVTYFFQRVPEPKACKNRMHLCLRPDDVRRDEEVERVVALGATVVSDHRTPEGFGWVVLADPEGNEFCILRGAADRASDGAADTAATV